MSRIVNIVNAAFRGRGREVREISIYVSIEADGRRGVNIHGGTAAEAGELMARALLAPYTPPAWELAPVTPPRPAAAPAVDPAGYTAFVPPPSAEFDEPYFDEPAF